MLDLDVLVVTHSDLDHQGGAHLLKRANPSLWVTCGVLDIPQVSSPDALIAERYQAYSELHEIAPDDDALAWMRRESGGPVRVDVGWSGGELLELGPDWSVRILHVPGHSVGHVAVYDERSGALFSGDCLQGSVYLGLDGTPKLCPTYTHVDDYLATATLVESLAPRELHGCHWPAARGDEVAAFIAETRDYVEHVDGLVRGVPRRAVDPRGADRVRQPAGSTRRGPTTSPRSSCTASTDTPSGWSSSGWPRATAVSTAA